MDDKPIKFTKNKRLIENSDDGSHVGGSLRDAKKSLIKNISNEEEEYRARKEWEHQADINDAFGSY